MRGGLGADLPLLGRGLGARGRQLALVVRELAIRLGAHALRLGPGAVDTGDALGAQLQVRLKQQLVRGEPHHREQDELDDDRPVDIDQGLVACGHLDQ
ncbi:MAG: hypothetical protein IPH44_24095 [Myxococcales bacterium]|nr:hypothetical protein [Myxococcales bacterium]